MKVPFELRRSSIRIIRKEKSSEAVSDVVMSLKFKTGRKCGWQEDGEGEAILTRRYTLLKQSKGQYFKVGLLEVVVFYTCIAITLSPVSLFAAMDAQAKLGKGTVGFAIDVNYTFNHLSSIVKSFIDGDVY